MRNPVHVAKAVGTAAVLSGNRVALGIGVGWMREEFELSEQRFERRGARTDEMIEVMRTLWKGGWVEHHGEFYDFDPLEMSPVPTEEVPIWSGGISEPALKRAATLCDGWVSDLHSSAELAEYAERLARYRAESDRAGKPFTLVGSANDAYDVDGYRKLHEVGVTHLNTMPWAFYAGPQATLEEKCDGIRRFGEGRDPGPAGRVRASGRARHGRPGSRRRTRSGASRSAGRGTRSGRARSSRGRGRP